MVYVGKFLNRKYFTIEVFSTEGSMTPLSLASISSANAPARRPRANSISV